MYQVVCFVIDIIVCSYLILKDNCMFMKDSIITVELDNLGFIKNIAFLKNENQKEIYLSLSEVAQSCPTLCDPVDCILPGSFPDGILQARILEWVAISFSRGSSQPRDQTGVSRIAGRCFNLWATSSVISKNYTTAWRCSLCLLIASPYELRIVWRKS